MFSRIAYAIIYVRKKKELKYLIMKTSKSCPLNSDYQEGTMRGSKI